MNVLEYDSEKAFDYENGFYLTSDPTRISKLITHYELYKMTVGLPGHILECGVFKGASLIQFSSFRDLLENPFSKRLIGFDMFGPFPETEFEADKPIRERFINEAGLNSLSVEDMEKVFEHKGVKNFELVAGDINQTLPEYVENNPQLKISLLHIDTDIYEPAKTALEQLYDRVVRGGVIIFDDYGTFPGETKAVDEFFADKDIMIKKLPQSHWIPAYIIKP